MLPPDTRHHLNPPSLLCCRVTAVVLLSAKITMLTTSGLLG